MLTDTIKPGDILVATRAIGGIVTINKGDRMRYLGHSQVRLLDGPAEDLVMGLLISAPVSLEQHS